MDVAGSFPCGALDGVGCFAWMGESLRSFSPLHRSKTSSIPTIVCKESKTCACRFCDILSMLNGHVENERIYFFEKVTFCIYRILRRDLCPCVADELSQNPWFLERKLLDAQRIHWVLRQEERAQQMMWVQQSSEDILQRKRCRLSCRSCPTSRSVLPS
jgi:hypothetical protein